MTSEKVVLSTEGTFTIRMPCYKNNTATTKGFLCSTYVIHISAARGWFVHITEGFDCLFVNAATEVLRDQQNLTAEFCLRL